MMNSWTIREDGDRTYITSLATRTVDACIVNLQSFDVFMIEFSESARQRMERQGIVATRIFESKTPALAEVLETLTQLEKGKKSGGITQPKTNPTRRTAASILERYKPKNWKYLRLWANRGSG